MYVHEMNDHPLSSELKKRATDWEQKLLLRHGIFVGGRELRKLLGYSSAATFRVAAMQGRLPVASVTQPGRRGRLARVRDVALWLAEMEVLLENQESTSNSYRENDMTD